MGVQLLSGLLGYGSPSDYIASDWRELHLKLPLTWRTRNYVGTIFGGSMFAALDPVYMVMLIKALGRDYVVWDKAATIRSAGRRGRPCTRVFFCRSQRFRRSAGNSRRLPPWNGCSRSS